MRVPALNMQKHLFGECVRAWDCTWSLCCLFLRSTMHQRASDLASEHAPDWAHTLSHTHTHTHTLRTSSSGIKPYFTAHISTPYFEVSVCDLTLRQTCADIHGPNRHPYGRSKPYINYTRCIYLRGSVSSNNYGKCSVYWWSKWWEFDAICTVAKRTFCSLRNIQK